MQGHAAGFTNNSAERYSCDEVETGVRLHGSEINICLLYFLLIFLSLCGRILVGLRAWVLGMQVPT